MLRGLQLAQAEINGTGGIHGRTIDIEVADIDITNDTADMTLFPQAASWYMGAILPDRLSPRQATTDRGRRDEWRHPAYGGVVVSLRR